MAMLLHPAMYAKRRGPKSRAGFSPAWVNGARTPMTAVTVKPIRIGTMSLVGRPTLQPSVSKKIVVTSKKVPKASTRKATGREMPVTPAALQSS